MGIMEAPENPHFLYNTAFFNKKYCPTMHYCLKYLASLSAYHRSKPL